MKILRALRALLAPRPRVVHVDRLEEIGLRGEALRELTRMYAEVAAQDAEIAGRKR